ncbi:TonB-dependent receptor [Neptunitalea lumnitzerae]|uniref:TonB-dependent receptor n=1 Tax=Neptunitalea lumnitzerae TaxID=2965509 RepID=A0ABQ5MP56_9FLAO|nr:TonB-dependent receptor [Neptunitalea sp. Y10]GLB50757.1 TonB-dependent receptor [Neptunitalea sp. Y10]
MKAIKQLILTAAFLLIGAVGFSQVTGTVTDGDGLALPGATVSVKGTSNGTTTDYDGKFTINATSAGVLTISYVGFITKEVSFSSTTENVGTIALSADAEELEGVVVIGKGVIDLEDDRKTPIAVSTITTEEIQAQGVGNVEFPEIMKNTPNVYVASQAGGFGDSQMYLRGFDQSNTAFLLNGQPINGMEDGNMYWSNWSGLADIANAVQVQRGLGSSKLAISSVGGTVNIVTKATDLKKGGFARFMTGNDSYFKGTVSYNTGVNENGWGFSFMVDHWQGYRDWAAGTQGEGQNYFFSVGKLAGDHKFNFMVVGAPQSHGQNYTKDASLYETYGRKYNSNYGYLNGEFLTIRKNFYHKPVMNLNWDWDINDTSSLSTVVYASVGRGGGTGTLGNGPGYIDNGINSTPSGAYTADGLVDWDYIVNDYNPTVAGGISSAYNGTVLRASMNNHAWYGLVTNYEKEFSENFTVNVGADVRFYKGDHFRQLVDLLGLTGRQVGDIVQYDGDIVTATFDADPWSSLFDFADEGERVAYDYSENLNYQGVFGQAEYANDVFSVFVQGAVSNQSYKREDRTNFATNVEGSTVSKIGYNVKGGASYTFVENNKVFFNAGFYSRQPYLDNVFPSYDDYTAEAENGTDNEEIIGLEAGYRFGTQDFSLNLNAFYTEWSNRFDTSGGQNAGGESILTRFTNITQRHKGLELDMKYTPTLALKLNGYFTFGEYRYEGTTPFTTINTDNNNALEAEGEVDLSGTRVGGAPQLTGGLGASYDIILNKLSVNSNFNFVGNIYQETDGGTATSSVEPEKLNDFGLVDLGASYNWAIGNDNLIFRANVFNLFDRKYVSQKDSYGIFYGPGTTWNFSVKYSF